MRMYLLSLGAGVIAGIIYSLLDISSPAPPLVALVGLLGILAGEQIVPVVKRMRGGSILSAAWRDSGCTSHMFGTLPGHRNTMGGSAEDHS
jgi:XapX domain-containing protein